MCFVVMCCTHVATIMSKQPGGNPIPETLFSFELLVEYIRIDNEKKISDELAVGIRLLDFPTLLIYPPEMRGDDTIQHDSKKRWVYSFNRGKSCFFEMNLDSLYTQLTTSPLYVMILDVNDEIPKLLGTSLISLAGIMNRIKYDSVEHDAASCSSYGERGVVRINNLAEESVGVISLSYKLLLVGASLPSHVTKNIPVYKERCAQKDTVKKKANETLHSGGMRVHLSTDDNSDDGRNNVDKQAAFTQTEHNPISQIPHTIQDFKKSFDEDLTVFCPPHLYYCNSGKEKHETQGSGYRLLQPDSVVVTHKDTFYKNESENSSVMDQSLENIPKISPTVAPKVLEEALKPLPLLNALFVELSQLNAHSLQHHPVSNHPDLVWNFKIASPEASDGQMCTPKMKPNQESKVGYGLHSKYLHSPRTVSPKTMKSEHKTPMQNNPCDASIESKAHRKKLVYGTTKTYNLRRQKNCTVVNHRDCMASQAAGEKRSSTSKGTKMTKLNSLIPKENIKTIQNMGVLSVVQDTAKLKHEERSKLESPKQDREVPPVVLPCAEDDGEDNDAISNKHPELFSTWTKVGSQNVKLDSCKTSSHSSHKSLSSDSDKEEEYADDFNSFEASDADTTSSPKPAQSKPQELSFFHRCHTSDSDSETVKDRPLLPAPIRGHSPIQRVLKGTHLIRPQTRDSALSFSSDEDDKDGSGSVQVVHSKKQEKEEGCEATLPGGQKCESSSLIWRGSSDSNGSDPLEAEELDDDLGSLDFRKEYQHISDLVGFKLPGYTM